MPESTQLTGAERREHYRIETRFPIRARALTDAEAERLTLEITAPREDGVVSNLDRETAALLERIERKLDWVMAKLDQSLPRPLSEANVHSVRLSGSGLAFEWDGDPSESELALLEFDLPATPVRHIRAIARPVSGPAQPDAKPSEVPFSFMVISEADRDAIVRFSHEVQRSSLRERAVGKRSK